MRMLEDVVVAKEARGLLESGVLVGMAKAAYEKLTSQVSRFPVQFVKSHHLTINKSTHLFVV